MMDMIFSNRNYAIMRRFQLACLTCFEWCMLLLGPILIVTVMALVGSEFYWAFEHILPLFVQSNFQWTVHAVWICYLAFNVLFNYFSCVTTNPGTQSSPIYKELVFEACSQGKISQLELEEYCDVNGFEAPPIGRSRTRRRHSSWIDRDPFEWGYCKYSQAPKAPRSHYDHVTRKLVLNMDHYCPWMFNVVGFANYRYFVVFLFWIFTACVYGVYITAEPFCAMAWASSRRRQGMPSPRRPRNKKARSAVMFTFVLALSVGIAVSILFFWHVFLLLTGQTTIEFYGNATLRHRAKARGFVYRNPYDQGYRRNFQSVFGSKRHPLVAVVVPSRRPPPARPWPERDPRRNHRLDVV